VGRERKREEQRITQRRRVRRGFAENRGLGQRLEWGIGEEDLQGFGAGLGTCWGFDEGRNDGSSLACGGDGYA
jgi:hypothetical protein